MSYHHKLQKMQIRNLLFDLFCSFWDLYVWDYVETSLSVNLIVNDWLVLVKTIVWLKEFIEHIIWSVVHCEIFYVRFIFPTTIQTEKPSCYFSSEIILSIFYRCCQHLVNIVVELPKKAKVICPFIKVWLFEREPSKSMDLF